MNIGFQTTTTTTTKTWQDTAKEKRGIMTNINRSILYLYPLLLWPHPENKRKRMKIDFWLNISLSESLSLSLSLSLYLVKLAFGGFPYVLIRRDTGAITILFFVILQIRKEEINLKRKKKRKFQISPFPFSRSTHNTCLYNIQPIHTHTHFD